MGSTTSKAEPIRQTGHEREKSDRLEDEQDRRRIDIDEGPDHAVGPLVGVVRGLGLARAQFSPRWSRRTPGRPDPTVRPAHG